MPNWKRWTRTARALPLLGVMVLSACSDRIDETGDGLIAPGVNRLATAEDGLEVGHRLVTAGEYELALKAFTRAAITRGETDAEILLGMGTANLGLGRVYQAEDAFRLAIEKNGEWPELWNNLGVTLMEQGKTHEAAGVFRKAYALDNGNTDSIRDNLTLALSKTENSGYPDDQQQDYKLVRRGSSDYLISRTP